MASTVSPPKPWERAQSGGAVPTSAALTTTNGISSSSQPLSNGASSSSAPTIPERPSSLNNVVNRTASNYTNPSTSNLSANRPYGSTGYGSSYGSSSYGSPYGMSSPYSRLGGMGGYGMGGGYGGMSSMYGGGMGGYGMGGGYGGMGGGMYGGMPGQNGMMDPNDPNASLTNNFAQSTQATFQIIESIVGAFGGFAQMLESTYMATHSSFFAMVSVADQLSHLRQTLGSILGIYALLRWTRTLLARISGRPPPADATALTPSAFAAFASGASAPSGLTGKDGRPIPRPSKKPFVVFCLAVFGLPYLMGKLIRAASAQQANQTQLVLGQDGQPLPPHMQPPHLQQLALQQQQQALEQQQPSLDPSKLDFCKVLYDYPPAGTAEHAVTELDLSVKKGDLVAVLDKSEPEQQGQAQAQGQGKEAQWWRCRARDGRMGWLPAVYLETIQRRPQTQAIKAGGESRASTMPASVTSQGVTNKGIGEVEGGRAQTITGSIRTASRSSTLKGSVDDAGAGAKGEGPEKFQKAWVNEP